MSALQPRALKLAWISFATLRVLPVPLHTMSNTRFMMIQHIKAREMDHQGAGQNGFPRRRGCLFENLRDKNIRS
jgi:hypothetical protein